MSTPSCYRPDLVPADIKFDSWADLWKPELKGKLSAPDFDTSHLVAVAAKLEGARRCQLGEGQRQAEGAEAELQGLLRQRRRLAAIDAEWRSAGAGDAVDERLLHREPGCEA